MYWDFQTISPPETAGLISIKFHIQHPGNGRLKICSNGPGLMVKMATMPIYGKNLKKSSSPEPLAWLPWTLVCNNRWLSTTKFIQMVTLGWPWPIFHEGQIWSLGMLNGKKLRHCFFPKQWYSVIWKKVLCSGEHSGPWASCFYAPTINDGGRGYSVGPVRGYVRMFRFVSGA